MYARSPFAKKIFLVFLAALILISFPKFVFSQTPTPSAEELQNKIKEYEAKIKELRGQAETLSSQIQIMDNQIKLTEARIEKTKEDIAELEKDIAITKKKIAGLEDLIEKSTKVLLARINAVYQVGTISPWQVLLTSDNISNFLTRLFYLQIVQVHDKKNIFAAAQAKMNYSQEKAILEGKQKEEEALRKKLEDYNTQLTQEKIAKQHLLDITKNDEKRYQTLLAAARAEYEAIQGIIAGQGQEIKVGHIEEGQKIASVIEGASCNSGGTHLHFIVSINGNTQNPFGFLKSGIDYENCSGPGECSEGDPFNPSGSWNWPLNPKIRFYQGYGETWAVRNTWVGNIYKSHNGIDIGSTSSLDVKAVKSGTLYRGSYSGYNGCSLRYVKVVHDEGGIETYYLHVNYF